MKSPFTNSLKITVAAIALLAAAINGRAQSLSYYYSHYLLNTNTVILGQMTTNFVPANYHATGPFIVTKGITANDPNASGYTFQLVTAQVNTNNAPQYATNVVLTLAPLLDDESMVFKYPLATNQSFTVTNLVAASTNATTFMVLVPAANTLGAKQFKLISAFYGGTNALNILSGRVGYWY